MTMRSLLLGAVCLLIAAAPASADLFANPTRLPNGDPNAHPYFSGGEPSIAFDPTGDGHVYVTAPQGIPTAAGEAGHRRPAPGIGFWASDDAGHTFPRSGITGSGNGGGDSDVEVLQRPQVLAADLEATATAICSRPTSRKTFPDCSGGVAPNQQGPENDREWLTRGAKPGEVYLTYHDFAGGFPIIEKSTDGGQTFTPVRHDHRPGGPGRAELHAGRRDARVQAVRRPRRLDLRRVHHARPDRAAGRRRAQPPLHGGRQGRLQRARRSSPTT